MRGDVLLITDGECEVTEEWMRAWNEREALSDNLVHSPYTHLAEGAKARFPSVQRSDRAANA
jgi:hypothetical protein